MVDSCGHLFPCTLRVRLDDLRRCATAHDELKAQMASSMLAPGVPQVSVERYSIRTASDLSRF